MTDHTVQKAVFQTGRTDTIKQPGSAAKRIQRGREAEGQGGVEPIKTTGKVPM